MFMNRIITIEYIEYVGALDRGAIELEACSIFSFPFKKTISSFFPFVVWT